MSGKLCTMPRTIRIAGRRIRVLLETPIHFDVGPDHQAQGLHEGWVNLIRLDKTLAPDQLRAVAVHEVVHDLESLVGLNLTERDVTAFASALFALLRDNPRLVAWLMDAGR